ncbi:hypothetical protein SNE40_010446 [Patella caerulea]|uniref:Uncharacterized protein n=1 Tax=Patella caerulea TaxID=87958 RepID=A0AAN8JTH1_PATCE
MGVRNNGKFTPDWFLRPAMPEVEPEADNTDDPSGDQPDVLIFIDDDAWKVNQRDLTLIGIKMMMMITVLIGYTKNNSVNSARVNIFHLIFPMNAYSRTVCHIMFDAVIFEMNVLL